MSGDDAKKPDPVDDLKKGLGLLFRAAKTAVEQLPKDKLEQVVATGVREVGRAIENVTDQLDRQVFHGKGTVVRPEDLHAQKPADAPPPEASPAASAEATQAETKPEGGADEPPKGPRVG